MGLMASRVDGKALVAGDLVLGVGWGTTATKTQTGTDGAGQVVITSAGTGQAQATATVVLTFTEGSYGRVPTVVASVTSNSAIDEGHVTAVATATGVTFTFSVLPVATKIYTITWATF